MPGLRAGPSWRVVSPSGGSILITSAPRSPSCWAAHGPSTTVVQSRILTPSNGPAIDVPPNAFCRTTTNWSRACAKHDGQVFVWPPPQCRNDFRRRVGAGGLGWPKRRTIREAWSAGERASPPLPWRPAWWARRSRVPTTTVTGSASGTIMSRPTTSSCRPWPITRRGRSSMRRRRSSIIRRRWPTRRPIRPMVRRSAASISA